MSRPDDRGDVDPDDLRDLAPAYALGALDEPDRLRFERALEASPELRAEVEAFRAAAAPLGESLPPVAPPPGLKADLFARLDATPQERPVVPVDGSSPAVDDPSRAENVVPGSAPEASEPAEAPAKRSAGAPAGEPPVDELAARRRRRNRIAIVLSSAAAVLLVIGGVVVGLNWAGPNGWGAQREMAALAAAPDAERTTSEVSGGGEVTLVWSAEAGRSAIIAEGLPAAGDDRTYELWYIDESGATSAGTFDVHGQEAWRILQGDFAPGVAVGITIEPEGGSEQPTTDPIAVIPT